MAGNSPMEDATIPVTYKTGYSATAPLISSPALQLDAISGNLSMTATQKDVTVLAILIKEYRNGKLISTSVRDMQLVVMDCAAANTIPVLSGIDSTNSFTVSENCPTDTISFFLDVKSTNGTTTVKTGSITILR